MTYPPTYPDVAPEIEFETIDEDEEEETGELTEEETETVLGQLNTIVSGRRARKLSSRMLREGKLSCEQELTVRWKNH